MLFSLRNLHRVLRFPAQRYGCREDIEIPPKRRPSFSSFQVGAVIEKVLAFKVNSARQVHKDSSKQESLSCTSILVYCHLPVLWGAHENRFTTDSNQGVLQGFSILPFSTYGHRVLCVQYQRADCGRSDLQKYSGAWRTGKVEIRAQ